MAGLTCPRCGKENVTVTEDELNLAPVDPKFSFPFFKCSDCRTRFYFYEDVLAYMATLQKMPGVKKNA